MYERFYNLRARPFQLMPDPRRLYQTGSHERGLSYLLYGLERGEGVVVVTGDVGTGKTLLIQVLLGQIATRGLSIARVAMANASAETVVASVAAAFGVTVRGLSKVELLDALATRLSAGRNRRGLLIVDEAQACSDAALEELRLLSNLQARGQALLQVVLIGQTELADRLRQPGMSHLRQRIVASFHLEPLTAGDVAPYIEHRLTTAGWRAERLTFGPGVYARVHEWSRGIPRRINQVMDRLLLLGYLEEKRELTRTDLDTVIEEFETEFGADGLIYDAAGPAEAGPSHVSEAPQAPEHAAESALLKRIAALEDRVASALGEARLQQARDNTQARELAEAWARVAHLETILQGDSASADEPEVDESSPARGASSASREDMSAMFRRLFSTRGHDE
ncbi:ExeA family protein [Salinisphaera sp. Q1T1-3]|uniref:ExeA family protein n=1 Tax=Salinisphaera sp. Q1T1-3 TaxID=2321229 RepID=UPI000E75385D|nr:AAA family ATPase [Salinisphaera sp. Q1T1-3]RJS94718.1 DUF2075 domain-containing protein [Salinisphaera sp. Q1T1-3]